MRLRDHNKGDLALTALTLTVAAAAVISEAVGRYRRRRTSAHTKEPPGR
jgi:hypothetical protein